MNKRDYTEKQISEMNFHDGWGNSAHIDGIDVHKYFTAETSVDYKLAKKKLGKLGNKRILDLGCGLGESAVYFALQGAQVTAVDISPRMLNCVKRLSKKYKVAGKLKIVESPAEKLPFKDGSFDLIFGGNVLHHVDIIKTSRETNRILKKGGKAVFIEPLGYNPLIQFYRKLAKDKRTMMERPFTFRDIRYLSEGFKKSSHTEQQLLTTLIFVWFFFGERLHPSKVRYWKKIIDESERYAKPFKIFKNIDHLVLKLPFIKRLCWSTVIEMVK